MHLLQNLRLTGTAFLRFCIHMMMQQRVRPERKHGRSPPYALWLVAVLLCGVLFYLVYRTDAMHRIFVMLSASGLMITPTVLLPDLPLAVYHSFPSLIGGLSVVLFVACLHVTNRMVRYISLSASLVTLLLFEIGVGYFHWLDVMATVLGGVAGLCLVGLLTSDSRSTDKTTVITTGLSRATSWRLSLFPATAAVLFSSFLALGSTYTDGYSSSECARFSEEGYCEEYKRDALPVYMSYENLRNSVRVEAARAPDRIGRLYLYGNYVLLNEINEGIHIIDNADPTAPVNTAFIRIPGNTEIAVRDNYLYADSYVDLITLDINDLQNVTVVGREQLIFPYDEYQNIPQNISLTDARIDREQGVVVSYRLNGS